MDVVLIKSREAAKILAISERTLWDATKNKGLPCVKIGRSVRYDPADLASWVKRLKDATQKN